jgi:predicted enzyme related to lactoylglutathione lyase
MEKIYKYGFYSLFLVILILLYAMARSNPLKVEGQPSWIEIYSDNFNETATFLAETLGIKTTSNIKVDNSGYILLKAEKSIIPFGSILPTDEDKKINPHSTIYFTVFNYNEVHKKFINSGAKEIKMENGGENIRKYLVPGNIEIGIVQYVKN